MNLLSVHLLLLQLYEIIIVFNNVNIVHTCLFYTYVYGLMRIKIYIYIYIYEQFVYLKKNTQRNTIGRSIVCSSVKVGVKIDLTVLCYITVDVVNTYSLGKEPHIY